MVASAPAVAVTIGTTPFSDVPTTDPFASYIEALYNDGITTGCGNGDYCPSEDVTRDQMAAFIVRSTQVKAGQSPATFTCTGGVAGASENCASTTPYFLDVPATDSFFPYVQKLHELGITTGCGNRQYCPTENVSRDQMAAFIIRALFGANYTCTGGVAGASVPCATTTPYFSDVPATNTFFPYIQKLQELGITTGCGNGQYCPSDDVTMDQMAAFLARGFLGADPPSTACTTAAVSVTVTDSASGEAVQGANVTAGAYATATGATGLASFTGLSSNQNQMPITISVTATGFTAQTTTALLACGTTASVSVSLVRTYSISGTITANGKAISGFPVTLSIPSNTPSRNYVVVTTDVNGNFIFTGVSNGTYRVSASSACYDFSPVVATITVNNADITGQNFAALSRSGPMNGVVSGIVADLRGVPIPGVTITAYDTNCNNGITATTDANGAYAFTTLGGSDYQFYPEMTGFGFYPSLSCGAGCRILDAGYWGLDRTVIHVFKIPATPVTGADFTAYRPGDKVVSLPRTGQTISFAAGDDASANKGVAWPVKRFTDNKDGTVTDGLTGLIWMKDAECLSPADWSTALNEANNLASGQCGLTDGSTAGQWRMPNAHELESIVDISQSDPAVTGGSPFTNISLTFAYWSSTSNMSTTPFNFANDGGTAGNAMAIRFTDGRWIDGPFGSFNSNETASTNSLWAVKSGPPGLVNLQATGLYYVMATGDDSYHSCPFCEGTVVLPGNDPYPAVDQPVAGDSASFVNSRPLTYPRMADNGNGTVSDTVTGLTWLKKADCIQASWEDAVMAVNSLESGQCGLTDGSTAGQWRMPNRFEMLSLAQRDPTFAIAAYYDGIYGPDGVTVIGPVVFSTFVVSQNYWTSSTYAPDTTQAWTVYSCDFGVYNIPKSSIGYTMAVR